jgi:hypothetical protein
MMTPFIAAFPITLRSSEISMSHEPLPIDAKSVSRIFNVLRSGRPGSLIARGGHLEADTGPTEWELTVEDGNWIARIRPDAYSLHGASHCAPPSAFRAGIFALTRSIESVLGPVGGTALRLRYIHHLDVGPDVNAYRRLLRPQILEHATNGAGNSDRVSSFPLDHSLVVDCKHGFVPSPTEDDALTYSFDTTIVRHRAPDAAFCTIDMLEELHALHIMVLNTCLADIEPADLAQSLRGTNGRSTYRTDTIA